MLSTLIESGFLTFEEFEELNEETDLGASLGAVIDGIFPNSREKGLFIGVMIPQKHIHVKSIKKIGGAISYRCSTKYLEGFARGNELVSERIWISAKQNVKEAIDTFASFIPSFTPKSSPPVGWNSWDYYFSTVSLKDVIENMDVIKSDQLLSEKIKYIAVDDGWQAYWGEWYPNYKFPGGIERLVEEITSRGFIPGIWTAPLIVKGETIPALRIPEMLVKDEYGDPQGCDDNSYLIDPTHPTSKKFLREIFTRLHAAGIRYFKIDFVHRLLQAKRLHDPSKGLYEAISDFCRLVRECVGEESFILGCGIPIQCGPGIVDAGRVGVDIHNLWSHVTWSMEGIVRLYWAHNRIWINDPDFLIVRGKDTSSEAVHNVTNFTANKPNPSRWRGGPDLSYEEAKSWASICLFCGGSIMSSDLLSVLNQNGMDIIRKCMEPTGISAEPLDLCDGPLPTLWLQKMPGETRLTIINWLDLPAEISFDFAKYGIPLPASVKEYWTDDEPIVDKGVVTVNVPVHGSKILVW